MTDFATLELRIDSTDVSRGVAELDKLTAAGSKSEDATARVTRSAAEQASQMRANADALNQVVRATNPAVSSQQMLDGALKSVERAYLQGKVSAELYARAQSVAARGSADFAASGRQVSASAGQQRVGMQQLSFQIGDVAQQFALGTPPMRIFAQQGGQVVQAIGLMRGSAGGLVGFLAGPWGAVMIGAVTILGSLWAAHSKATSAIEDQSVAAEDLAKATNELNNSTVSEMRSTQESIRVDIVKANTLRTRAIEARRAAIAELELAKAKIASADESLSARVPSKGGVDAAAGQIFSANQDIKALNDEIAAQNAAIAKNEETIRLKRGDQIQQELTEKYDGVAAATGKFAREQDRLNGLMRIGIINETVYRSELDKAIVTRDREEKAARDAQKKPRKPRKEREDYSAERLAERLAREATATEATIAAMYGLADAYLASDAAGLKAEARANAAGRAIRAQGDVEAFVAREMRKLVAERAVDGAKAVSSLSAQSAAQKAVNDAVSAGTIPASQAGQALQNEAQLRPLIVAQAVAEGAAKDELAKIIARLRGEQSAANAEAERAQVLAGTASANDDIERLKLEAKLIGETNAVRSVALSQLAAEQFLRAHPGASANEARAYTDAMREVAQLTADNTTAQDNYNAALSYTADLLGLIHERSQIAADALNNAFGNVGAGIGTALTVLSGYAAAQAKLDQDHQQRLKAIGKDEKALNQERTLYSTQSKNMQLAATAQVIGGLKSMFKEHSTGYKAMEAAERAFAIIQAINTIKSVAAGAAKMFSQLGVWAFPAVAAMVAVMAGLGFSGGTSSQKAPTSPEDLQAAAGTGSVLGDSKAKSESISRSLELVASNTNKDLEYSNQMLIALRSIDTSIAKMAGTVARQIQVAGSLFDTSKLNLGSSGSGGFLGIGKKTVTRSLYDLGLNLNSGSVADIIANGISGTTYQIVQRVKTKSGFLGLGGGTKTSYETTTGAIDGEISSAIQDVVKSLRDGLLSAADVIGLQGAQAILNSFNISLGKISFKDMTGQQIEDQLNAIFSKVGDDMAGAIFPALKAMQKVGEGMFETFIRVAREYEVVDVALKSIGRSFGAVGVSSVAARDALVQLFGGLDQFVEATSFFRDQFLSEAEQMAPIISSVRAEMTRLGLSGVTTRDQFKNVVMGLDLTTTAGREMYAALLNVAPAFDKTLDYFEKVNKTTIDGLNKTIDQFAKFAESLRKYRDTLFATDTAQGNAYALLKARFLQTAGLAAQGDATALGGLETAGKSFLDAAKNNASTREQYLRDVAIVAQGVDKGIFAADTAVDYAKLQLDALNNAVSILGQIAANTGPTQGFGSEPAPIPVNPAPAPTPDPVPAQADPQLVTQNQTIIAQNQTIIDLLSRADRFNLRLEGDGMLIRTDADSPIKTQAV